MHHFSLSNSAYFSKKVRSPIFKLPSWSMHHFCRRVYSGVLLIRGALDELTMRQKIFLCVLGTSPKMSSLTLKNRKMVRFQCRYSISHGHNQIDSPGFYGKNKPLSQKCSYQLPEDQSPSTVFYQGTHQPSLKHRTTLWLPGVLQFFSPA